MSMVFLWSMCHKFQDGYEMETAAWWENSLHLTRCAEKAVQTYNTGATIPHIYFRDYKKELLPLLRSEEQRIIANKLDKARISIENTRSQLKRFDKLAKSQFSEITVWKKLNRKMPILRRRRNDRMPYDFLRRSIRGTQDARRSTFCYGLPRLRKRCPYLLQRTWKIIP